jgi:hypothetical protein
MSPDQETAPDALSEALSRTSLLLRDHVRGVSEPDLVNCLTTTSVSVVADEEALSSLAGQEAVAAVAILAGRMGASVRLEIPRVPLLRAVAPLKKSDHLDVAIREVLSDLLPIDRNLHSDILVDVAIRVGRGGYVAPARQAFQLDFGPWTGFIGPLDRCAVRRDVNSPFGAMIGAALAAAEVFKVAAARLCPFAIDKNAFMDMFRPVARGALSALPVCAPDIASNLALGSIDLVSGGAIAQSTLYALSRVTGLSADIRIIEPELSDLSNLNRYALLRLSNVGQSKAKDIQAMAEAGLLGDLRVSSLIARYEACLARELQFAETVITGVDHIPTRWLVQEQRPNVHVVGATSHYNTLNSIHFNNSDGCAGCAHPYDEATDAPLPTVSFVSQLAGVFAAALAVQHSMNSGVFRRNSSCFLAPLRSDNERAAWWAQVPIHPRCPVHARARG